MVKKDKKHHETGKSPKSPKFPAKTTKSTSDAVLPEIISETIVEYLHEVEGESPIDLCWENFIKIRATTIEVENFEALPLTLTLKNTAYNIVLTGTWPEGKLPSVSKGPLSTKYEFAQAHFHWGVDSKGGSDHDIEGVSLPFEVHLVFYKASSGSLEEAKKEEDGIVSLCYMYKIQETDNEEINLITDNIKEVTYAYSVKDLKPVPLIDLFDPITEDYIVYLGFMKYKAVHGVTYIVSRETHFISEAQLSVFRELKDRHENPMILQKREVQMFDSSAKVSLKKLMEAIEEYSNVMAREADDLLEYIQQSAEGREVVESSTVTIQVGDIEEDTDQDVLSIFFSPEVKNLGKKSIDPEERFERSPQDIEERVTEELERVPSPIYRIWEGLPCPEIEEHMHPDGEAEFMSSYKFRGPLCTYLERSEIPQDLQGASRWLVQYMLTVAKIMLSKVKEIETGLSIAVLKDRAEEEAVQPSGSFKGPTTLQRKETTTSRVLAKYLTERKATRGSVTKAEKVMTDSQESKQQRDSLISGFGRDQVDEEETDEVEEEGALEKNRVESSNSEIMDGSPFSAPKAESPEELEAFADLIHQLDNMTTLPNKIKLKQDLMPQYIIRKTAQVIQQNNTVQLENTALEIFMNKLHITLNYNMIDGNDKVQPTWGQILSDSLYRLNVFKPEAASVSNKENTDSINISSDKGTPSQSISSSIVDTDTMESVSVSVHELSRYMYTPPTEVISFEPLTSNHFYGVKPPQYRFMPIEEAVKRADEKRDLTKRIYQMKKEIVRTFLKELDSDSESDEGEETGWRKWFCYERRQELVSNAIDSLVLLNVAQHNETMKTLRELSARKQTILREIAEKTEYCKELVAIQKIKETPVEKRLPSQRRFSDVLFKTMKSFLANDLKTKNLMLAHQRTLTCQIIELTKTVRHLEHLEKKTDWGDLALQRLQYNSAHKRNATVDEDITQLKKLNATYTLKLIHAREELDAKVRENRNLMKQRDLSVRKKNAHKESYMIQHKKLLTVQEDLNEAPKVSDVERFVILAKTEDYKKKKMRQYQTELEVKQANKKVCYLQSRINGLSMEPETVERLRDRHKKVVRATKLINLLETWCAETEKKEFGVGVIPLQTNNGQSD